jgi:hypothetical protein
MLVFSTQLCELLPLSPSPWFNSPPPPLSMCEYVHCYCTVYCIHVRRVGYGVLGLRQINICRKAPLQVNFLEDDISHCLL